MKLNLQYMAAAAAIAGAVLIAPRLADVVDRVNDAHSEEVGNKPNLLEQWVDNAPDFDKEPTVAGFIKKWAPVLEKEVEQRGRAIQRELKQ